MKETSDVVRTCSRKMQEGKLRQETGKRHIGKSRKDSTFVARPEQHVRATYRHITDLDLSDVLQPGEKERQTAYCGVTNILICEGLGDTSTGDT